MADRTPSIEPWMASRIWRVLVECCRARDSSGGHYSFVHYLEQPVTFGHEYRFMGALGFGGKFYNDLAGRRWRVSCYTEDDTPARKEMIRQANERLAELRSAYVGESDG